MADDDNDDTYLDRPNRRKASSKATKAIVAFLLLATAVLMVIITIGGWNTLEGAKLLQVAYILLYVLMAFFVMRWNRGVLPVAAALAIVLPLVFLASRELRMMEMGDDAAMLDLVTSASVACGGHASDPETMFRTLTQARERGVVV